MTAASACGISAMDLATMMAANTTSTATKIKPATAPSMNVPSLVVQCSLDDLLDDGGRAVDLDDRHMVTGFVDLVLVQRARGPDLAVEFHLSLMASDPVEHQRALALQR